MVTLPPAPRTPGTTKAIPSVAGRDSRTSMDLEAVRNFFTTAPETRRRTPIDADQEHRDVDAHPRNAGILSPSNRGTTAAPFGLIDRALATRERLRALASTRTPSMHPPRRERSAAIIAHPTSTVTPKNKVDVSLDAGVDADVRASPLSRRSVNDSSVTRPLERNRERELEEECLPSPSPSPSPSSVTAYTLPHGCLPTQSTQIMLRGPTPLLGWSVLDELEASRAFRTWVEHVDARRRGTRHWRMKVHRMVFTSRTYLLDILTRRGRNAAAVEMRRHLLLSRAWLALLRGAFGPGRRDPIVEDGVSESDGDERFPSDPRRTPLDVLPDSWWGGKFSTLAESTLAAERIRRFGPESDSDGEDWDWEAQLRAWKRRQYRLHHENRDDE